MKLKTFIAALAVLLCVGSAQAQDQGGRRQRQRMNTTEMYTRNAERMVKQMKLDEEKAQLFTVLYLDYMTARQNAANPKGEEETDNQKIDMKKLTEEQAKELIEKQFRKTEAQVKVDREYYPKFLEILTAVQTTQVFLRGGMGGRQGGNNDGMRGGGFPGGGFPGGGGDFGGGGFPGGGF